MSHESIAYISNITGIGRETVARKLRPLPYEEGARGAKLYNTVHALPKLYIVEDEKLLDLTQARAVLATKQTEKIDLDMELKRGDFIIRDHALTDIIRVFSAFRAKMLAIPTKAVARLKVAKNAVEQEQALLELIHEALKELTTPQILDEGNGKPDLRGVTKPAPATETDSK